MGPRQRQWIVSEFTLREILCPDDLSHPYALLRAWDRHLISVGLLPISTSDSSKVGPILVDPAGEREFYEYSIVGGVLVLTIEILQASGLRKSFVSATR